MSDANWELEQRRDLFGLGLEAPLEDDLAIVSQGEPRLQIIILEDAAEELVSLVPESWYAIQNKLEGAEYPEKVFRADQPGNRSKPHWRKT